MSATKIKIQAVIAADSKKVWDYYTQPKHITKWNFASDDWQCPSASNDMKIGGKYIARMEAKDGSFGFDFEAVYTQITVGKNFSYVLGDGRNVKVEFKNDGEKTIVDVEFEAENENPIEMQQEGWQAILNNFKNYTETN